MLNPLRFGILLSLTLHLCGAAVMIRSAVLIPIPGMGHSFPVGPIEISQPGRTPGRRAGGTLRSHAIASHGAVGNNAGESGNAETQTAPFLDARASGFLEGRYVHPEYPSIARLRGQEGSVWIDIEVSEGKLARVFVRKSSGFLTLDNAALQAVRQWAFVDKLSISFVQKITFQLEES